MTFHQHARLSAGDPFAGLARQGPSPDPVRPFAALAQAFGRWRRQRVAAVQLHRLGDRVLRDIGIEQGQVEQVAYDLSLRRGGNWLRL